jgi:hypothetical protein
MEESEKQASFSRVPLNAGLGVRMQQLLCWIFSKVYRKWLMNDFTKEHDKVMRVIGWRTMRTKSKYGKILCVTPIFWWLK